MRCKNKNCLNDAAHHRKQCNKCKARAFREKHPLRATYLELRCNARKRFIKFSLTFDEWGKFCKKTDYLTLRGVMGKDMTVDRKDPRKGYEYGNIQMITKSANTIKQKADAWLVMTDKKRIPPKGKDDPF